MKPQRVLVMLASAAAVGGALPVAGPGAAGAAASASAISTAGGAVPAASSWDRAIGVPGLAVLNKGGNAEVKQVSCGSAGNCAAGGVYLDSRGHAQGFVASKKNGVWGRAIEVPG